MIGILGGTFDPIHFGHIKPALDVLKNIPFEHIRFIPSGAPLHRPTPLASAAHRWEMLNIVTRQQPGFVADDRELRSGGPVYTVDTLTELRSELGCHEVLCWIMGADAFAALEEWHQWERILDLCHIIVMARPGILLPQEGALAELLDNARADCPADLVHRTHGRILIREASLIDISATSIRKLIAQGEAPRYLLPGPVWNYIRRYGLYNTH